MSLNFKTKEFFAKPLGKNFSKILLSVSLSISILTGLSVFGLGNFLDKNAKVANAASEPNCSNRTVGNTPTYNAFPIQTAFPNPTFTGTCQDLPELSFFNSPNISDRNKSLTLNDTITIQVYYNNSSDPTTGGAITNPFSGVDISQSGQVYNIKAALTGNNATTKSTVTGQTAVNNGDLSLNLPTNTRLEYVGNSTQWFPQAIIRKEISDSTGKSPSDQINDNSSSGITSNPVIKSFAGIPGFPSSNGVNISYRDTNSDGVRDGNTPNQLDPGYLNYGFILFTLKVADTAPPLNTNLAIVKSAQTPAGVNIPNGTQLQQGQVFDYKLSFNNTGNLTATGVSISDVLNTTLVDYQSCLAPNGFSCSQNNSTVTLAGSSLSSQDGLKEALIRVRVKDNVEGTLLNQATIDSDQTSPVLSNQTSHPILPLRTNLTITKSANPVSGSSVVSGQEITYSLNTTNAGSVNANNVVVTDVLDTNLTYTNNSCNLSCNYNSGNRTLTWNLGTLTPNQNQILTFRAVVNPGLNNVVIRNSGTVSSSNANTVNSNEVIHTVNNPPILGIAKTSNPVSGSQVESGQTIQYNLTVTNNGFGTANNTIVTDTLDSNVTYINGSCNLNCNYNSGTRTLTWNLGNFGGGAPVVSVLTFSVTVNNNLGNGTLIINTGSVQANNQAQIVSNPVTHTVLIRQANLQIRKSTVGNYPSVKAGDTITYQLEFRNIGDKTASNVVIQDFLDPGVNYVNNSCSTIGLPNGANCGFNNQTISWNVGSLPVSQNFLSVQYQVTVKNNTFGTIHNVAKITSPDDPDGDQDEFNIPVLVLNPALQINKSLVGNPTTVKPNDVLTYQLSFRNIGNGDSYNTLIVDALDPSVTYLNNCSTTGLPFGANCSFNNGKITWNVGQLNGNMNGFLTVTYQVRVNSNAKDSVKNIAKITSTNDPTGDEDQVIVPILITNPALQIQKSIVGQPAFVNPNDVVTYQLAIRNVGNGDSINTIVLDSLDPSVAYIANSCTTVNLPNGASCSFSNGKITWNVGTLPANQSLYTNITYQVKVNSNALNSIRNIVKITSDNDPTGDEDEVIVAVREPQTAHLQIRKTVASGQTSFKPGDTATYKLEFRNVGLNQATNVLIQDFLDPSVNYVANSCTTIGLPSGATCSFAAGVVTWNVGTLTPSQISFLSVQYQVTLKNTAAGTISNLAIITSPDDPTGDQDETTTPVILPNTKLTINKSADRTSVIGGDVVNYTLSFRNVGTDNSTNVVITDTLDQDSTYQTGTCTLPNPVLTGSSCSENPSGSKIITWNIPQMPSGNTVYTVNYRVTINQNATGTIRNIVTIRSTEDPTGDQDEYTIPINPTSSSSSSSSSSSLSSSSSSVSSSSSSSVSSSTSSSVSSSSSSSVSSSVSSSSSSSSSNGGIQISKAVDVGNNTTVKPGQTLTYSITAKNNTNTGLTNLTITDNLDPNLTFLNCSNSCSFNSASNPQQITWIIPTVNFNSSIVVTFQAQVKNTASGTIKNAAIASCPNNQATCCPSTNCNSNEVDNPVDRANLTIVKTVNDTDLIVFPSQTLTYTLTYKNTGLINLTNVVISDQVPNGVTYVANSCAPSCTFNSGNRTLTWNVATLTPNTSGAVTFDATVDSQASGQITNVGQITATEIPNPVTSNVTVSLGALISSTPRTGGGQILFMATSAMIPASLIYFFFSKRNGKNNGLNIPRIQGR